MNIELNGATTAPQRRAAAPTLTSGQLPASPDGERLLLVLKANEQIVRDWDLLEGRSFWGDGAAGLFGVMPDPGTPDWWLQRIHHADRPSVTASFQTFLASHEPRWAAEYRILSEGGASRSVEDRCFAVRDKEGEACRIVGAIRDVTSQNRAAETLRTAQMEAAHLSRLSAMSAMASTLAHELNQPLTVVTGYISGCRRIIKQDAPDLIQLARGLEAAEAGAHHAAGTVKRLRELVHHSDAPRTTGDLADLIENAWAVTQAKLRLDRVGLDLRCHGGVPVSVDRVEIQQVLISIMRIAAEPLHAGGRLVVAVDPRADNLVEICITAELANDPAELMAPSKIDDLGFDLSICRTIVEAHGGRIGRIDGHRGSPGYALTLPLEA